MSDRTTMPCPACRENGSDKTGEHLTVFPSGKFACAVHPGDKAHNRRIIELRPDLAPPLSPFIGNGHKSRELGPVVEKYSYHDQSGQEIYQVWRHDPKDFSQHRIINGEARPTLEGIARVPYRLPEVLKSETVWIVEGEKDADSLAALDIVATCNAGGAGKWQAEWSHFFEGKHVVICGDNDAPGRKHVEQVLIDEVYKACCAVLDTKALTRAFEREKQKYIELARMQAAVRAFVTDKFKSTLESLPTKGEQP